MRPVVVVGSSNGSTNLGDQAMWEATAAITRASLGPVPIVTDAHPGWVPPIADVRPLPFLHEAFLLKRRTPRSKVEAAVGLAINLPARSRALRAWRRMRAGGHPTLGETWCLWATQIESSSAVVFSGAGGMTDEYALHGVLGWAVMAEMARQAGVPYAFVGQGVGPLRDRRLRDLMGHTFAHAGLITTRDAQSAEIVGELASGMTAYPEPDLAIARLPGSLEEQHADALLRSLIGSMPYVVISFHHRKTESSRRIGEVTELGARLVALASTRGLASVLLPNATSSGRGDDRNMLRRIRALCSTLPDVHVVEDRLSVGVAQALCRQARAVASTRYHPLVFALAAGTPAVGLAYDEYYRRKFLGALEWYGEERRYIEVGAYGTEEAFLDAIDESEERREERRIVTSSLLAGIGWRYQQWLESL